MKKVLPILLALLVLMAGFAFAGGAKEAAAEKPVNTTLRLLTWGGYAPEGLIEKFKEETGITVEVIKSNNEEMISKLRATRGGGFDPFELYNDLDGYKKFLDEIAEVLIAGKPVVRNYYDNGDQLLESMRSGELVAAMAWEQGGWKLHAENPDIDYIAPTSGSLAWVDTFAIPAKSENIEGAYLWMNFIMRAENAAVFTNAETYGTASKDAGKYLDAAIADNFKRGLPPEALARTNWYPTVPAGLEEMEGKIMDRIRASK